MTGAEALLREAERTIAEYGAALIEEFIEGREFTVLVAEPRHADEEAWVLEPVEFLFPPGESFKHFDLKWKDYELMEARRVSDPALAARLREASALTFVALGGSGYGRCDIRMDGAGTIYLLEINPNCEVFCPQGQFGSADFILANDPAGHRGFLKHLRGLRPPAARPRLPGMGIAIHDPRAALACSPAGRFARAKLWSVTKSVRTPWSRGSTWSGTGGDCGGSGSTSTPGP